MSPRGPCLPSPFLVDETEDWVDFVGTPRGRIVNPWPQLVDLRDPRIAYSQSLMRLVYYPLLSHIPSRGRSRPETPSDFVHLANAFFVGAHELLHLCLDMTPSRELARVALAEAHLQVHSLLTHDGSKWDETCEAAAERLAELNDILGGWADDVVLAEELMTTALAFHEVDVEGNKRRLPDGFFSATGMLETKWVRSQRLTLNEHFAERGVDLEDDEFEELYLAFRRIFLSLVQQRSLPFFTATARLTVFLEPIHYDPEVGRLQSVDSRDRCHEAAEMALHLSTGDEFVAWLDRAVRDSNDWEAWEKTLAFSLEYQRSGPYEHPLWAVTRDSTVRESRKWRKMSPAEQQQAAWQWGGPKRRWSYSVLTPIEAAGRWFINASVGGLYAKGGDYFTLLILEALRQQIAEKDGIHCPAMDPGGSCTCAKLRPELKASLERLAEWSEQDCFGDGRWNGLAPPCQR